jgi:Tfp pilus assembly protein PilO
MIQLPTIIICLIVVLAFVIILAALFAISAKEDDIQEKMFQEHIKKNSNKGDV